MGYASIVGEVCRMLGAGGRVTHFGVSISKWYLHHFGAFAIWLFFVQNGGHEGRGVAAILKMAATLNPLFHKGFRVPVAAILPYGRENGGVPVPQYIL